MALTLTLSAGAGSLLPGQSTTITVTLAVSASAAALQFDYSYPGLTAATPLIGAAAAAAGKSISSTSSRIVLAGGVTLINPGVVATFDVTVPLAAPAGTAVISLSAPVASDASGSPLAILVNLPLTLIILSPAGSTVQAVKAVANAAAVPPTITAQVNVIAPAAVSTAAAHVLVVSGTAPVPATVSAVAATVAAAAVAPTVDAPGDVAAVRARATALALPPRVAGNGDANVDAPAAVAICSAIPPGVNPGSANILAVTMTATASMGLAIATGGTSSSALIPRTPGIFRPVPAIVANPNNGIPEEVPEIFHPVT